MLWCQGVQNIGLSNVKLKSALKCTVWLQFKGAPDRQTDRQTDEHFKTKIDDLVRPWTAIKHRRNLVFFRSPLCQIDCSYRAMLAQKCCHGNLNFCRYVVYGDVCGDFRDRAFMSSVPMSLLTGAARQPLFSVILPRSIYLCLFAKFSPLQTVGQPPDAWRSVSTVFRYTACVRIFPAHCAGVTNKSPHYNCLLYTSDAADE